MSYFAHYFAVDVNSINKYEKIKKMMEISSFRISKNG